MSKINGAATSQNVPLFAHLLQSAETQVSGSTTSAPTYHCLDSICTKKYPSDGDEPTVPYYDK